MKDRNKLGIYLAWIAFSLLVCVNGQHDRRLFKRMDLTFELDRPLKDRQTQQNSDVALSKASEVGFHVALIRTASFRLGDTVVFDHVITNLGSAFSPETGTFTCPFSGTYLFNLNILCDKNNYMEAAIMQNDTPVFKALSYNRTPNTYNQGSGSAILRLAKGDKVKVVMVKPSEGTETLLGGFSHFSGYMLSSLVH